MLRSWHRCWRSGRESWRRGSGVFVVMGWGGSLVGGEVVLMVVLAFLLLGVLILVLVLALVGGEAVVLLLFLLLRVLVLTFFYAYSTCRSDGFLSCFSRFLLAILDFAAVF